MKYLNCIAFSIIVLLLMSCEKDNLSMPDMTTSGLNTFGCYVDDNLFVHKPGAGPWGHPSLMAYYDSVTKDLRIYCWSDNIRYIGMQVLDSIVAGNRYELDHGLYTIGESEKFLLCKDFDNELYISTFDIENEIISGTFLFTTKGDKSDSNIKIKEGRFDIKLIYYGDNEE